MKKKKKKPNKYRVIIWNAKYPETKELRELSERELVKLTSKDVKAMSDAVK